MKQPLIIVLTLICSAVFGQNLVPNPSFEEYSDCPDEPFSQFFLLEGWTNPTSSSPDYFNSCVTNNVPDGFGVPTNYFGFQEARTGNAYVGIRTMQETDVREYIQIELVNDLLANQAYSVAFFVSNSENSQYASNDIGVYFSSQEVIENSGTYLPYTPHVSNSPSNNGLDNQAAWIEVRKSFVAQGGERFMIIGNFYPDEQTDTVHSNQTWNQLRSYHYIDDVCVSVDSIACELHLTANENFEQPRLAIYPNPVINALTIDCANFIQSISVFDIYGRLIEQTDGRKQKQTNISLDGLTAGVYTVVVVSDTGQRLTKRILKK